MSGHNKWSSIKHKKAKTDAAKGKAFTKVIKEIQAAVRESGADPENNARLRLVIEKAKKVNMPQDNIKRAIQRADKGGEGANMEEIVYEAYAPHGVALLIEVMTDNRNRTTPEIRSVFNKSGGNLGESGSVAWMFQRKGYFTINDGKTKEEDIFEPAVEAGAEDISTGGDGVIEVQCDVSVFDAVRRAIEGCNVMIEDAEITYIPTTTVAINDVEAAQKVLKVVDKLEDLDDVQSVYANFDIPSDILQKVE